MASKTHYVGQVIVEAVTVEEPEASGGRYAGAEKPAPRRTKHTVATVRIGDEDLPTLVNRISAHLELVRDGGDIDG